MMTTQHAVLQTKVYMNTPKCRSISVAKSGPLDTYIAHALNQLIGGSGALLLLNYYFLLN
jgi:hypothetical protein